MHDQEARSPGRMPGYFPVDGYIASETACVAGLMAVPDF